MAKMQSLSRKLVQFLFFELPIHQQGSTGSSEWISITSSGVDAPGKAQEAICERARIAKNWYVHTQYSGYVENITGSRQRKLTFQLSLHGSNL
jgi:hypothetical protein